ncbi:MAG: SGNH/GDSL hydrolase family protein [Candidatus Magasanikbacteria bacterium]|nr:SGNH/GDSL hydrolase family protein [Candidatus Magasanikbacteria bacterium]
MNALFRRIAATLSLLALFSSVPLSFVQAQQTKNIVIIGDSQGDGFKAPMKTYLESQGFRVIKTITHSGEETRSFLGAGGHLSRDGFNSISEPVYGVVVFLGGNDCGCASASGNICQANDCGDNLQTSLSSFVNTIKQKTSNIVWIGTMWSNGQPSTNGSITFNTHKATSQIQQATLPGLGVKWYPGLNKGIDYPLDRYQAHFGQEGYTALTQCIGPLIKSALDGGNPADRECRYGATVPAEEANPNNDQQTTPVTDALGRTQEDVNRSIAARCEDTNPVFPVTLGISIGGVSQVNGLTEYINVVYRYLTSIVLVVAIVMVTYGGFRYLVSATPLGVSDGKDIIKNGIVGMVLVLGAYVILNTINPATTVLQFTSPPDDIICREFTANFGYSGSNSRRNAVSNCSTDTDCSSGQKCLETRFVRSTEQRASFWSSSLFGSDGEPTGLASGQTIKECSDGTFLAPCGTDDDCKGESGLVCESNSWKLCIKTTNNPVGSPCTSNDQCVTPSGGSADCVSGYRNAGTVIEDLLTPNSDHDFALCRGSVEKLQVPRLVEVNWVVPEDAKCTIQPECEDPSIEPDSICNGPRGGTTKICLTAETEVSSVSLPSSPCFRSGNSIYPRQCATDSNKCVFCKGGRITELNAISDPEAKYIGACLTPSSRFLNLNLIVGNTCTGGAP